MIHDYLESFNIGDESFLYGNSDETQKVIDFLNGDINAEDVRVESYTIRDLESLDGLYASLNSEYSKYHLTIYNTFANDDNGWDVQIFGGNDAQSIYSSHYAPRSSYDSYIVIISSVPWGALENDPSLINSEFLVAYGVAIQSNSIFDEVVFNPSDPMQYVDSAIVDGTTNVTEMIVDRSQFLADLFNTGMPEPVTSGIYTVDSPLSNFELTLKSEYQNYHIIAYRLYDYGDYIAPVDMYEENIGSFNFNGAIPYDDESDDYFIFMVSPYPFEEMEYLENPYENIIVFGITFRASENFGGSKIDPTEYIDSFVINDAQQDIKSKLVNGSRTLTRLLRGNMRLPITQGVYEVSSSIPGFEITLSPQYSHLNVHMLLLIDNGTSIVNDQIGSDVGGYIYDSVIPSKSTYTDNFFFIISEHDDIYDILNDIEFFSDSIVTFGISFRIGDGEDETIIELPPETINTTDLNDTQFVRVLDGTTLKEYSVVPDIYNVKISQSINGAYTLNFNLLPYTNASNIYTPRIVECDNEYFHVQTITKRHELQNLEMDIHCEHVSYELNYPPPDFFDDVAGKHVWTDDTYEGTASQILGEMLQYNGRFSMGLVEDGREHTFKTSSEGFRTRINEFAEYIGLEVKWSKFKVSLLKKRGHNNGLIFEVGKNIVGLTEVIDTVKLGKTKRSYELDVIDLNYIKDDLENPLEAHNITIGDVITIRDSQYLIERQDRVVALTRDPFKKALPTVEFTNNMSSYTANGNSGTGGSAINLPIYQEKIYRHKQANALGKDVNAGGQYSFVTGESSRATGEGSFSNGYLSRADGDHSFTSGYRVNAEGKSSFASGYGSYATGDYSVAMGYVVGATGSYSNGEGAYNDASGYCSHAEGYLTTSSGAYSHAEGCNNLASGWYSHASNYQNIASGEAATAHGYRTIANSHYSMAVGIANRELSGSKPILITDLHDELFVVGNGFHNGNGIRSTGFIVRHNGHAYVQNSYQSGGADYGEYFEWVDGNPNSEERKGYVVTFEGDKIRIANVNDSYVLGVVSVNPSMVGNSYEDQWNGMYLRDEWGQIQHETITAEHEEMDENGEMVKVQYEGRSPIVNPEYNQERDYIPRSKRKEWATIGMLGKLTARDDGSCQINKYAKLSKTVDGILSHSDERTQFFVLRRVSENIVEVLIK